MADEGRPPLADLIAPHEFTAGLASWCGLGLSHFVPGGHPFLKDEVWFDAVRPHFSGEIVVGRDLLERSRRAGRDELGRTSLSWRPRRVAWFVVPASAGLDRRIPASAGTIFTFMSRIR